MSRTLSASQINTLYACQRKWAFKRLQDIKPPQSYPMVKGSYLHAIMEDTTNALGDRAGRDRSELKNHVTELTRQHARTIWNEEAIVDGFENQLNQNKHTIEDQMDNYVRIIMDNYDTLRKARGLNPDEAWRRARPDATELGIRLVEDPEDEYSEWLFNGSIDLVYEKHPLWFGKTVIVDYKTGSAPYDGQTAMKAKNARQLDVYAWLFWQAYGVVPDLSAIRYLEEDPSEPTSLMAQQNDPSTVEVGHYYIQRARQMTRSNDPEDYPKNTDYTFCHMERDDKPDIKCDHWEYCLGDKSVPEPVDRPFTGRSGEPLEVAESDPTGQELLAMASDHPPVLREDDEADESSVGTDDSATIDSSESSGVPDGIDHTDVTSGEDVFGKDPLGSFS